MTRENLNDLTAFVAVARVQLYQCGGKARRLDLGLEPHDPRSRGATRAPPSDPHDTQRLADSSRRATASFDWTTPRRDRFGARLPGRFAREAGWGRAHHERRAPRPNDPVAGVEGASPGLSGHT